MTERSNLVQIKIKGINQLQKKTTILYGYIKVNL